MSLREIRHVPGDQLALCTCEDPSDDILLTHLQSVWSNDSVRATIVMDFILYYGPRDAITRDEV